MTTAAVDTPRILELAAACGAVSCGIATAEPVAPAARKLYADFIAEGRHASMQWMERNSELRDDPRLLLDGARSLIVCLFNYHSTAPQAPGAPYVARYALGRDYHRVLRQRLRPVVDALAGYDCRICVDSAPLRERYWASRSGAALVGLSGNLIVPGRGTAFLVATILTTAELSPTPPLCSAAAEGAISCERCEACVKACPTGALRPDGSLDARRCLSYLTIEAPDDLDIPLHTNAFGCDACRIACPHARHDAPSAIADFAPRPKILNMTAEQWRSLTPRTYEDAFNGTPIRRASLTRLLANINT